MNESSQRPSMNEMMEIMNPRTWPTPYRDGYWRARITMDRAGCTAALSVDDAGPAKAVESLWDAFQRMLSEGWRLK